MSRKPVPPQLEGEHASRLLEHYRALHGTAEVLPGDEEGIPILCGARKVAVLRADGPSEMVELLVLALSALLDIVVRERRRHQVLGDRLGALAERLNRAEGELAGPMRRRTEDLRRQREVLRTAATTDGLTDVLNRRGLEQQLRHLAALSEKDQLPMAVLLIDLDHFKDVNDTYGHLAGDMVLASLGSALKEGRRRDDVVGRWGGEEFAVGLPACPWSAAHRIAEEIRERVGIMEVDAGKHVIRITASIGLAVGTVTRQQLGMESIAGGATHLLALADQELYKAKARGRNRVSGIEWYLETEE